MEVLCLIFGVLRQVCFRRRSSLSISNIDLAAGGILLDLVVVNEPFSRLNFAKDKISCFGKVNIENGIFIWPCAPLLHEP